MTLTATLVEIASERSPGSSLWSDHSHWLGDEKITAIHGHDKSTADKYAALPEGHILVTLRKRGGKHKDPHAADGESRQVGMAGDTVFELIEDRP